VLLALATAAAVRAQPLQEPPPADAPASRAAYEITAVAPLEKIDRVWPDGRISLPLFKVFDRPGRLLWTEKGFDGDSFRVELQRVLDQPQPTPGPGLADELAGLVTPAGNPIDPEAPPADFTFVKYWAEWCLPCHRQSEEMAKVLAANPLRRIAVIEVEADRAKLLGAAPGKPVSLDPDRLPEDLRDKLLRGEALTPEEAQRVREAGGQGSPDDDP
jgi:thiol-disulfide isomerase/thioredoxin